MKWVTRERARVDRIACPWLISRFIDPKPEFLIVPSNHVLDAAKREDAIPYDVPNVELGHRGPRCSFLRVLSDGRLGAAATPCGVRLSARCRQERGRRRVLPAARRSAWARRRRGGAGTEPDPELSPGAVKGLAGDGLTPAPNRPRPVTLYDLSAATRVISFGCDIASWGGHPVEQWDVPAVSDGYERARSSIVEKVERLVGELAGR